MRSECHLSRAWNNRLEMALGVRLVAIAGVVASFHPVTGNGCGAISRCTRHSSECNACLFQVSRRGGGTLRPRLNEGEGVVAPAA